jgi:hypothetical protein
MDLINKMATSRMGLLVDPREDLARRLLSTVADSISVLITSTSNTLRDLHRLLNSHHMVRRRGVIAQVQTCSRETAAGIAPALHLMQPGPRLRKNNALIKPMYHPPDQEGPGQHRRPPGEGPESPNIGTQSSSKIKVFITRHLEGS